MGEGFTIRNASPDDSEAVISLQEELFPNDPIALQADEFDGQLHPMVQIFVATQNNKVIGFVVLRNRSFRPWTGCDFIGVSSSHRRGGVGRKLVEHVLQKCRRQIMRPLFRLFVQPSNPNAFSLYKSLHFRQTSIRANNYPDGEDAIVMMRFKSARLTKLIGIIFKNGQN